MRATGLALGVRRHRRIAAAVTGAYLLVYLLAIRNLVISPGTDFSRFVSIPSIQVAPDWTAKVFKQIAAFYYEPVAIVYPINHVALLVSPVNLLMGLALGFLVGANVALAVQVVRTARSCRARAFTGLLGALPGFLTGFACCVPTVALVVGAQFTVALVALRSYFFPLALASLALALAWNGRRLSQLDEAPSGLGTGTAPSHSPAAAGS
ncbi:MAG: hypothetical protein ACRDIW_01620 [Actinomycetota bacterium]